MEREPVISPDGFSQWVNNRFRICCSKKTEKRLEKALAELGITIDSLFCETDFQKIRIYISELVLRREKCGLSDFIQYKEVLDYLVYYSEYLESREIMLSVNPGKDIMGDTLLIAYYLSRTNYDGLNALGYKSFSEAFIELSKILNQKKNTIKNMRDEFDPLFDNGRKGWYQRPLSKSRKEVYDKYQPLGLYDLTEIVKSVLQYYQDQNKIHSRKSAHKKIKIETTRLKEIKSGKRNL